MDISTANPIKCHIKREGVNTIWPLFTNSYPWFTANLPVIYINMCSSNIYCELFLISIYAKVWYPDYDIFWNNSDINEIWRHCMHFYKNHSIQDMCQVHGELTLDFRINVLNNLVLSTFGKILFRQSKIAN